MSLKARHGLASMKSIRAFRHPSVSGLPPQTAPFPYSNHLQMICVTPLATGPSTSLSPGKGQIAVSAPSRARGQKCVKRATEPSVHTSLPTTQISSVSQVYNAMNTCHLVRQGTTTKLCYYRTCNQVLHI